MQEKRQVLSWPIVGAVDCRGIFYVNSEHSEHSEVDDMNGYCTDYLRNWWRRITEFWVLVHGADVLEVGPECLADSK